MNEMEKKMIEYAERFDDGFPSWPLARGRSNEEVIEIINRCLKEGRDVYELGYITDSMSIAY